jgi:uncharacterized membrane protein
VVFCYIIHAVTTTFSLIFGAAQLLRSKGTKSHKIIGRLWVVAMYLIIFSSFGIQTLNGGFSWLHALSILTFFTVSVGLIVAIKGRVESHKAFMIGSYFGILGAFVGVIAVPSRRIPQLATHDFSTLLIWTFGIVVSFLVIGLSKINRVLSEP